MQQIRRTGLVKRSVERTWPAKTNELQEEPVIVVPLDLIMDTLFFLSTGVALAVLSLAIEVAWVNWRNRFISLLLKLRGADSWS
jgi:hypothetical protein